MFTTPQPQAPQTVRETIHWLLRLGRPPLPECPIEAAKQGKEPKQPCFLDGKYLKTVSWRQWQEIQPLPEILDAWFSNPKTGIGTLGGWNGKHWLGWIDFDRKDFPSPDTCDRTIQEWLETYPVLEAAPMFRTPSGGYRFLVAFSREPENFKANSGFSLKSDGSHHVGELLSKNGGHTLLPPTVGITGVAYEWMQWSEYPPVFEQPEDIGIYPLIKKAESEPTTPRLPRRSNLFGDTQLTDLLNNDILPRFSAPQAFNWSGHNLKEYPGGKLKGNCPWHESKSGTAFYCEQKNGVWLWRCPACEIGGGVVEYRHRLSGGNGSPRGREFVELVQQLAWEVGVSIPSSLERKSGNSSQPSNKVIPHPTALRSALNSEELFKRIDNLIERELAESELTLRLSDLAREAERHPKEVRSVYNARLGEKTQQQDLSDNVVQFQKLADYLLQAQAVNWEELLPEPLIKGLLTKSESSRIDPIYLIQSLLPSVGGMIGASVGLVAKEGETEADSWIEYPNVWTATIAPPSSGKSDADRAILNPIQRLQEAEADRYEHSKATLSKLEEAWKNKPPSVRAALQDTLDNPTNYKESEVGKCRKYLLDEGEIEAIKRRISEQPARAGSIWAPDELLGLFKGLDQFKCSGRGNARQFLLKAWNGPLKGYVDRVNENESFRFQMQLLTICGGIQIEPASQFFNPDGKHTDADGLQSRILPAVPTLHPDFDKWSDIKVSLDKLLSNLYEKLEQLPTGLVYLSPQAMQRWKRQWEKYRRGYKTYLHTNPAFAYFLGKMCSNLMRLALILHCLEHCYLPKSNFFSLGLDTLERAIDLASFYIGQFRLMQAQFTKSPEQGLSEFLMNILSLCLEEGRINPSRVINKWRRHKGRDGKSLKSPEVQEMFKTIAQSRPQQVRFDGKELIALVAERSAQMHSTQSNSAILSTCANSQLFEQTANGRSQGGTVEECDCTPRTARCDRMRSEFDHIRSEFDRPDRTEKVPQVKESDALFDQCDRPPSLAYELDTDDSLSMNLSVQPPVFDRTDRKTDETQVGEDIEAFDRPDRMRSNAIEYSDRTNTSPQGAASTSWNSEPISPTQFRVGDRVFWENCPSCCEELAPFEITAIDGDYAKLDLINKPVPLAELKLAT
jgi:hypothetical protein